MLDLDISTAVLLLPAFLGTTVVMVLAISSILPLLRKLHSNFDIESRLRSRSSLIKRRRKLSITTPKRRQSGMSLSDFSECIVDFVRCLKKIWGKYSYRKRRR